MRTILFWVSTLVTNLLFSQNELNFQKIRIPGAQCGDGTPYSVYLRNSDSRNLIVHFQGGGACWNSLTCFGPKPFTRLRDHGISEGSVFTQSQFKDHPFTNFSYLFIPYCTGDIFVGNHVARYGRHQVLHNGRTNTKSLITFIETEYDRLISKAKKLVVYGESAGALGALMNIDLFEGLNLSAYDKTLIADSPGLHFSKKIWSRFGATYLKNIADAMLENNIELDLSTGLIAKQMKHYCQQRPSWKMGVVQSTRDIVMSVAFGMRGPLSHRRAIFSKDGIDRALASSDDACSSWIPGSGKHVWALDKKGWSTKTKDGTVLKDYIKSLVHTDIDGVFLSHK